MFLGVARLGTGAVRLYGLVRMRALRAQEALMSERLDSDRLMSWEQQREEQEVTMTGLDINTTLEQAEWYASDYADRVHGKRVKPGSLSLRIVHKADQATDAHQRLGISPTDTVSIDFRMIGRQK